MQHLMALADWFLDRTNFAGPRDRIRGRTFIFILIFDVVLHIVLGIALPVEKHETPYLNPLLFQLCCLTAVLIYTKVTGKYCLAAAAHFLIQQAHMVQVFYQSQSLHNVYFTSIGTEVVAITFILGWRWAFPLVALHTIILLIMVSWNGAYANQLPYQLDLASYSGILAFSLIVSQLMMILLSWLYQGSLEQDYARLHEDRKRLFRSARTFDLSRMLGELNHHVNNPLSIIHAQLYRLKVHARRGVSSDFQPGFPDASQRALQKIRFMVEHLKVLATPDSHEEVTSISIRDLCHDILGRFQETFRLQGIALDFIDRTMNLSFTWRRHELFTILTAVVRNAGEAVESSVEKRVSICVERHPQWLVFVIRDTGPGITGEQRTRLFKPFHSTKAGSQHLGLSLLSAKAVLEIRGGFIRYEDAMQGGSFRIGLPLP
ncbi:sensor histidine kinase [Oligoflexus tunisiensis]|uniref:sensor histidine kinase n=1 Tax=Oligoflexus tunisiensis TaxID=708132 RepID=UPI00114CF052|nr:HAMP domain-containing sensor histidine kinase [Oligoflexus tunisiensis]